MPKILAGSVAEHRALIRCRILDAFGQQLHEHGYSGVTLAKVAAAAGIARNTIYNYAADKDELMLMFVQRSVDDFVASTADSLAAMPTAGDKLKFVIRAQMVSFLHQPGSGAPSGMLEGSSLPPTVFQDLMTRLSAIHTLLRDVVRSGVESGEFRQETDVDGVVELIGAMIGSQRMPVGERIRSVDDATARVADFVMAALRA